MSNTAIRHFTIRNEPYHYDGSHPLLSIHLATNRPDQFTQLVENVHATCANKNAYEIIFKIDTEDTATIECVGKLVKQYGEDYIKPLIGPKKQGPWSTWEFYNDMFHMTHPKAYFMWNPSDEVRFKTQDWDVVLAKYIGFFPDHIFRLKLSDNRLRNFYSFHEVLGQPDNFPFITKKWMDLCGLWGDCHSPDLFHQAISFYLGQNDDIFRDIPIFDIELGGIEAGLLIPPTQSESRTRNIRNLWLRALSRPLRSRYLAHAAKIRFFIQSCAKGAKVVTIEEDTGYPSKVTCRNDLGSEESGTYIDTQFIPHALRLRMQALLSKTKQILMARPFVSATMLLAIILFILNMKNPWLDFCLLGIVALCVWLIRTATLAKQIIELKTELSKLPLSTKN